MKHFKSLVVLNLFLVTITIAGPFANGLEYSRKLDENTLPVTPSDGEKKCGGCTQPASPPPPPPSCPPPPAPALPPPPPPAPKKPPTQYCPPPPSSFLYITGPPGNLYPLDQDFNDAPKNSFVVGLLLIGFGLLALLV